MKVVIMAGGKGTRISSVASDIPKPMIKIEGKPVLEHEIECLRDQGFKDIILTVSHLGNIIMDYFGDGSGISPVTGKSFGVNIEYYFEKEPLGNAGALFKIKDKLTEDFLLLNADAMFDVDFNRFVEFHKSHGGLVTLFTHPNSHPYDSGLIIANENGIVQKWLAKEDERPLYYKNRVNAGLHVMSPEILKQNIDTPKIDLDRQLLKPLSGTGKMFCYDSPEYVKDMGYTHIELMPITEHPLDESWGYQTIGYYSSTSRYGTPTEFKAFIDKCHENGIGVILDFAYSHFCKDAHGLYKFDGSAQFEYSDPLKAENIGWGTAHFDLGKPEVNSFLISNVLYWFNEYHIDGIRVDAVSSMLYLDYDIGEWRPNKYGGRENLEAIDFLKRLNKIVYTTVNNPIIIAEESTAWPMVTGPTYSGALGFTYKWNMGWMNDTLKYMEMDPIYRKHHHELITFSFMYAFSENFILPLSHDEVVHGKKSLLDKMPGDPWQKFASLRTLYAYYMMHPGKKLLFMGSEFGQGLEWRYAYGLEWELLEREPHMKMKDYVKDLNHLYKNEKALHEIDNTYEGFDFIDPHNSEQSIITLMRKGKNERDFIIAVINFTPVVRYNYKIGVPYEGVYEEVFNTDNEKYWGSNQTMESSELTSYPEKWHNKDNHIRIKVPPLGATFIKGKELKIDTIQIDPNSKVSIGGKDKKVNKVNPKTKTQKL